MPLSPTEFGKLLADDTEKWAKAMKLMMEAAEGADGRGGDEAT